MVKIPRDRENGRSSARIAIVGIGLRYPDAGTPVELWENVLAGRRAFRRLPDERMNHADYYSADPAAPDRFYSAKAAVLRDFVFDRVRYQVAGSTYRATDLTHWLALDVAAAALADAGFPDGAGLPRRTTGVVLGNSLTGEFSRANVMRLRWPYVRRTVAAALAGKGWDETETADFLRELEVSYKAPFPAIGEDTLAGALSNTIAGRLCNYFDFAGGGYTVDGACSSSLLSVATAAKALADGEIDAALAGGVDLSIDPFEVIGFAKTGALSTGEMKVYDRDSNGFWPGEGAGVLVLMREQDALARQARIYATISGWGVSSDGKGGMTRPEATGHRLALQRAYERAGYPVSAVSYFEGHGTGTALGDAVEIDALSSARRDCDATARPAALGTIKGNFGHTKAAAGVAGLIKAALAVHHQVIPPGTGQREPHPKLAEDDALMYVPRSAQLWPADEKIRAGVSAMGFGGINTHIAIEQAPGASRRTAIDERTAVVVHGRQDAELLLLDGTDSADLREQVSRLELLVPKLAQAELADLAGGLAARLSGGPLRAALVVTDPEDAAAKLAKLAGVLDEGTHFGPTDGIFVGNGTTLPRIAYLFPGQGSGRGATGAIRRRFPAADEIFHDLPDDDGTAATQFAQPRIVAGSLAAMRVLAGLGIEATTAVGHSLGELTALHWAGAMDEAQVLRLATIRGRVMAEASRGGGGMAGLAAGPDETMSLSAGEDVTIAGYNAPGQTVISGPAEAVDRVCEKARSAGVTATRINVSHAFHSPLVEPAAVALSGHLTDMEFSRLSRQVMSTVTAQPLAPDTDLRALLRDQVLDPVRFHEAAALATDGTDLVIEVGPGRVLTGLMTEIAPGLPVLPVDTGNASLSALLRVVGAAFAAGAPIDTDALLAGRVIRPLSPDADITFLASPCEAAPASDIGVAPAEIAAAETNDASDTAEGTTLDLLRALAAERVELPLETVHADTHPLDDLHLSSITVGQIVNDVTRKLGRPALAATPNFATVTLGELAAMIDDLAGTAQDTDGAEQVPGVAPWVRAFAVTHVAAPDPLDVDLPGSSSWQVFAPDGHPLARPLQEALAATGVGDGVLLCLPDDGGVHIGLAVRAGQAAIAAGGRFVVVQHRFGVSGLARSLHLEAPQVRTTVVTVADVAAADPARIVAEVARTTGYTEVRHEADGTRTVPVLRLHEDNTDATGTPLTDEDVLLVTGGGKGITAECALAMAQDSGASLALLGRADPAQDAELAANLDRMKAAGLRCAYRRADVTSPDQVAAAVGELVAELGQVTAVLHGAGRNEPAALPNLTEEMAERTIAPKVAGLRAVLAAVDQDQIKLLITFGSIIGRAGLRGEAHYACANDRMTELTEQFQREHPDARALALEWSVWSGSGMGERLGVIEALRREGITPISTEDGIDLLRRILADPEAGPVLVVTGRAGDLPTLSLRRDELPLRRFLDRVLVHYPGVELVTEAELSAGNDPYLNDHLLHGDLLFPAVLGMEAMTQVASVLTAHDGPPVLENVEFARPIVVRPAASTTIRIAALARDRNTVEVAIRSAETGFGADHFRATLRFPRPGMSVVAEPVAEFPPVPIDPVTELYGGVLFQGKRFQRLLGYRKAGARHAVAEIAAGPQGGWFAAFLPQEQLLADPGTRDTAMHAIQCCVPDATLLPQRVERLVLADPQETADVDHVVLDARERSQDGDSYCYDLDLVAPDGTVVERWEGLVLRAVQRRDGAGPWPPALLGSYVERSLERVLGGTRTVVVEPDTSGGDRRASTELLASRALDRHAGVRHRPDGKPEIAGAAMSASHAAGLTMVVTGAGRLGCDVETAARRSREAWAGLLSDGQLPLLDLLAKETGDDESVAATRIWSAVECLRKAGSTASALTLEHVHPDGWAVLSAGDDLIATWTTTINGRSEPVVFAVLAGGEG